MRARTHRGAPASRTLNRAARERERGLDRGPRAAQHQVPSRRRAPATGAILACARTTTSACAATARTCSAITRGSRRRRRPRTAATPQAHSARAARHVATFGALSSSSRVGQASIRARPRRDAAPRTDGRLGHRAVDPHDRRPRPERLRHAAQGGARAHDRAGVAREHSQVACDPRAHRGVDPVTTAPQRAGPGSTISTAPVPGASSSTRSRKVATVPCRSVQEPDRRRGEPGPRLVAPRGERDGASRLVVDVGEHGDGHAARRGVEHEAVEGRARDPRELVGVAERRLELRRGRRVIPRAQAHVDVVDPVAVASVAATRNTSPTAGCRAALTAS